MEDASLSDQMWITKNSKKDHNDNETKKRDPLKAQQLHNVKVLGCDLKMSLQTICKHLDIKADFLSKDGLEKLDRDEVL